jgi:hypothetical protein
MVNGFVLDRQLESACLSCMIGEGNTGEDVLSCHLQSELGTKKASIDGAQFGSACACTPPSVTLSSPYLSSPVSRYKNAPFPIKISYSRVRPESTDGGPRFVCSFTVRQI